MSHKPVFFLLVSLAVHILAVVNFGLAQWPAGAVGQNARQGALSVTLIAANAMETVNAMAATATVSQGNRLLSESAQSRLSALERGQPILGDGLMRPVEGNVEKPYKKPPGKTSEHPPKKPPEQALKQPPKKPPEKMPVKNQGRPLPKESGLKRAEPFADAGISAAALTETGRSRPVAGLSQALESAGEPVIIYQVPPRYPRFYQRRGIEGTVDLDVRVDEQGRVIQVSVAASSGYRQLDLSAMAAVRQWRFKPRLQPGRYTRARFNQRVFFKLGKK